MRSDLVRGHRFSRGAVPGAGGAGRLALGGDPLVRVDRTTTESLPHLGHGGVYDAETIGLLQVHLSPLLVCGRRFSTPGPTFVDVLAGDRKLPGDGLCGEPKQGSGYPDTLLRPSLERFYRQPTEVTRFRDCPYRATSRLRGDAVRDGEIADEGYGAPREDKAAFGDGRGGFVGAVRRSEVEGKFGPWRGVRLLELSVASRFWLESAP